MSAVPAEMVRASFRDRPVSRIMDCGTVQAYDAFGTIAERSGRLGSGSGRPGGIRVGNTNWKLIIISDPNVCRMNALSACAVRASLFCRRAVFPILSSMYVCVSVCAHVHMHTVEYDILVL